MTTHYPVRPGWGIWFFAAATLLAGCTASSSRTTVPAANPGHHPVPVAALQALLLPPDQLNSLLQVTGLVVVASDSKMASGDTTAGDCAATWRVRWGPVYAGSGWVAVRAQYLDDGDAGTHRVWQSVVSFPMPVDANAFYAKQAAAWRTCNNRRLEERYTDQPGSADDFWKLGEATENKGMLTMLAAQEISDGRWVCGRALTIRNNVAVDTEVCGDHVTNQAESVAKAIAEKIPVN